VAVAQESNKISLFTSNGVFKGAPAPAGGLHRPRQVSFDPRDGTLWVADYGHNRVLHMDLAGKILLSLTDGGHILLPQGVIVDAAGNVFVSNTGHNAVEKYSSSGQLLATLAGVGAGPGQVRSPAELAMAGTVGEPLLLIADSGNNRVVALQMGGGPAISFGSGGSGSAQFNIPTSVAYNPINGAIAVADFRNSRVSIWGPTSQYAMTPSPIAPTGSLTGGSGPLTITISARTAAGTATPSTTIFLAFTPTTGGGSAMVGATALSSTPQAFTADTNGMVLVNYSVPGSPPITGTDLLTAQNAASAPTITLQDSYSYG
jgi:DNA-binding beta-propeller fold protein YncE